MTPIDPSLENSRRLLALRGRYAGRRGFIIGNGPSLQAADLDRIAAHGDLSLATNKIFLIFPQTRWRPTLYLIGDTGIARASVAEIGAGFRGNVLFADYLAPHIPPAARYAAFTVRPDYVPTQPQFSEDLVHGVCRGATITYTAMQVAHWLGLAKVYLLGVDFNYVLPELRPSTEFPGYQTYTPGTERNYCTAGYVKPHEAVVAPNLEHSLCAFRAAQQFAAASPRFKIYNATRGGQLEVFPRVAFDQVLPPRPAPPPSPP